MASEGECGWGKTMNTHRKLAMKAFPFYCVAGVSRRSQILTVRQLSVHVNNLTLFLNYFVGADGFQTYDFLLQYMEALLLNS